MNTTLRAALQQKIDNKTKPQGALGKLEQVALQVGLIQGSLSPQLATPHVLLFAGDHGIVAEGVSPFPQAVTQQMVVNFVNGGAAINVFCRQHGITIDVVDAGVNADLSALDIVHAKIAPGTRNYLYEPAMTTAQLQLALQRGAEQVERVAQSGCNVIGFGEMGIGNTSSATLVFACLSGYSLAECTGRGTGLDAHGLDHKIAVLARALETHGVPATPEAVLVTYGGFELVMIVGAAMRAAELNMVILVDGFIVTAAIIAACAMRPALRDNLLFTHLSDERGHRLMLDYLHAEPLLQLNMRLGEGSGVAVTWPLVQSAVAFLNEMASFAEAGVSDREQ